MLHTQEDELIIAASMAGRVDVAQWCVESCDSVNLEELVNSCSDWSALDNACQFDHLEMCKFLLSQGARVTTGEDDGEEMMSDDSEADSIDGYKTTSLHKAVVNRGTVEICELLFHHGSQNDINRKDENGDTPLALAIIFGNMHTCRCLVDHGASVHLLDNLMTACSCTNPKAIEWLCNEHGARSCINDGHVGRRGFTPLMYACDSHSYLDRSASVVRTCEELFKQGAVDTVSESQVWTAENMYLAAQLCVVRRFGEGMSDAAISVPFTRCLKEQLTKARRKDEDGDDGGFALLDVQLEALKMLWRFGPRVVARHLPDEASDDVLQAAVRVGVAAKFVEKHPRLTAVLGEAVCCRTAFDRGLLFGCLESSGSAFLWRIGSKHAMAPIRKQIAQYAGVVWKPEEWARVRSAHHQAVVATGGGMDGDNDDGDATATEGQQEAAPSRSQKKMKLTT